MADPNTVAIEIRAETAKLERDLQLAEAKLQSFESVALTRNLLAKRIEEISKTIVTMTESTVKAMGANASFEAITEQVNVELERSVEFQTKLKDAQELSAQATSAQSREMVRLRAEANVRYRDEMARIKELRDAQKPQKEEAGGGPALEKQLADMVKQAGVLVEQFNKAGTSIKDIGRSLQDIVSAGRAFAAGGGMAAFTSLPTIIGRVSPAIDLAIAGLDLLKTAVVVVYDTFRDKLQTTEQQLQAHAALLERINKLYSETNSFIAQMAQEERFALMHSLLVQQEKDVAKINKEFQNAADSIPIFAGGFSAIGAGFQQIMGLFTGADLEKRFGAVNKLLDEFRIGLAKGTPDAIKFREELGKLRATETDKAVKAFIDQLMLMSAELPNSIRGLVDLEAKLRAVQGTASRMDLAKLGIRKLPTPPEVELEKLRQAATIAGKEEDAAIKARARLQESLELKAKHIDMDIKTYQQTEQQLEVVGKLTGKTAEERDAIIRRDAAYQEGIEKNTQLNKAASAALAESRRQEDEALDRLDRATKMTEDQTRQQQRLVESRGYVTEAIIKQQKFEELERAALAARIKLDKEKKEELDELAAGYARVAIEAQNVKVREDIAFEGRIMHLREGEQQIAQRLRTMFQGRVEKALESPEAMEMRFNQMTKLVRDLNKEFELLALPAGERDIAARLRGQFGSVEEALKSTMATMMRFQQSWLAVRDAASEFSVTLVKGLSEGKNLAEAMLPAINSIADKMIEFGTKRIVETTFSALIPKPEVSGMTTAATSASGIFGAGVNTAGLAFIGHINTAVGILASGVPAAASALPAAAGTASGEIVAGTATGSAALATGGTIAGTEEATGGVVGGGALAAGGTAASASIFAAVAALMAALGPLGPILVAAGTIAAGIGIKSFFGDDDEAEEQRKAEEAARKAESGKRRREDFEHQKRMMDVDTSTLMGQIHQHDLEANRARSEEIREGGEALAALDELNAAKRLKIQKDFQDKALQSLKDFEEKYATDPLSNVAQRLKEISEEGNKLASVLNQAGLATAHVTTIMTEAVNKLRREFVDDLNAQINEAMGKGYLNDFKDLIEATKVRRADAKLLGVDTSQVDKLFALQAQKLIDQLGLTGEEFEALITMFPELRGVVKEATGDLEELGRTIDEYLTNLEFTELSTLSEKDKFTAAQTTFAEQLKLAQGQGEGAIAARKGIIETADRLLKIAREFLGPSEAYRLLYEQITGQLKGLKDIGKTPGGGDTGRGYATGGIVGSGQWNIDSAIAKYAGGGNIMLAGGEAVTRATSVTPETWPILDFINKTGAPPANDNSALLAEISALRTEARALRTEQSRLLMMNNQLLTELGRRVEGLRADTRQTATEATIRKTSTARSG